VEHDQYYNGLDWNELAYDDCCRLIFMIESASYSESTQEEFIRRARHKENCDRMLSKITNGRRSDFGGTYESIINNSRFKKFFHVTRSENKNKKDTRIYPRISEIKQLVESKKTGKKYIRILNDGAIVHHPPQLLMDSAQVSESLTRQLTKARALSDSAQVSERIDVIVTRANPKEVSK
jgi:DNA mismatch repair ATPase MutS